MKIYNFENGIDSEEYAEIIRDLIDYLRHVENDWDQPKIFIDGEADSSQTDYEYKSNQAQIAVLSKSKIVGYVLQFFLRMIIDNRYELLRLYIEDDLNLNNFTLLDIIKMIEEKQETYTQIFSIMDEITQKLNGSDGKIIIKKTLDEIDIWTFERINKEMIENDL